VRTLKAQHLLVGVAGVLVFLGTGAYMATHFPAAYGDSESIRYMYRANHAYILLASLINLAIGLYRRDTRPGWRGLLARIGSTLVLAAPAVLVYAFFAEPPRAVPERPATLIGIAMSLAGVLLQWPNRARSGDGS
jgi:hypothetical protein